MHGDGDEVITAYASVACVCSITLSGLCSNCVQVWEVHRIQDRRQVDADVKISTSIATARHMRAVIHADRISQVDRGHVKRAQWEVPTKHCAPHSSPSTAMGICVMKSLFCNLAWTPACHVEGNRVQSLLPAPHVRPACPLIYHHDARIHHG